MLNYVQSWEEASLFIGLQLNFFFVYVLVDKNKLHFYCFYTPNISIEVQTLHQKQL